MFLSSISYFKTPIFCLFFLVYIQASLAIEVIDDMGTTIFLEKPAQKIISLSPHTTELIYSAGAGAKVVGVDQYSDYPEAVESIARIGDAHHLDIEKILSLQPDLIVAWGSGQSHNRFIRQLIRMKQTVYISSPKEMETIPHTVENLGKLAGTYDYAKQQSQKFRDALKNIINEYHGQSTITVFYEIWDQPLFTINGEHVMNKVIEICGGKNIFAELPILSPEVSIESVIAVNPEVIIASGTGDEGKRPIWLDNWLQWPTITAVKKNHLYHIPPDFLHRQTFRILQGTRILCEQLQSAR